MFAMIADRSHNSEHFIKSQLSWSNIYFIFYYEKHWRPERETTYERFCTPSTVVSLSAVHYSLSALQCSGDSNFWSNRCPFGRIIDSVILVNDFKRLIFEWILNKRFVCNNSLNNSNESESQTALRWPTDWENASTTLTSEAVGRADLNSTQLSFDFAVFGLLNASLSGHKCWIRSVAKHKSCRFDQTFVWIKKRRKPYHKYCAIGQRVPFLMLNTYVISYWTGSEWATEWGIRAVMAREWI